MDKLKTVLLRVKTVLESPEARPAELKLARIILPALGLTAVADNLGAILELVHAFGL